jgi:peptidoglycan/xylan/chitin deacetylase (PgdA/CDA1 family)
VNVACPTHPGKRAHKLCHFCQKAFCRTCEVRMRGHLYCSTRCARDAGRNARWRLIHGWLVRPVPARAAVFVVALASTAPVILALRTVRDLDRINAPSAPARPRREAPWARVESTAETAGGWRIEGSAAEGSAVFLFAAEKFIAAAPVSAGRFRFEGIRESGPYRVGAIPLSTSPAPLPEPPDPVSAAALAPEPSPPLARPAALVAPPLSAPLRQARAAAAPAPAGPVSGAPDLTRGPSDRREIVVSFDAGSSDNGAIEILDALAARGIRTTIFLTGEFIRRYPEIVRRVAADGHEVGNHTDTHPHLTTYAADGRQATRLGVDQAFVYGQLARAARLFREATGRSMAPLWRAPFGEHNAQIRRWAAEAGYWHVGWTGGRGGLDGMDWITDPRSRSFQTADRLIARLVQHAENGGIVLLHLGSDREEPVAGRVGELFDQLTRRGFAFARASEFLERQGFDETRLAAFRASNGALVR